MQNLVLLGILVLVYLIVVDKDSPVARALTEVFPAESPNEIQARQLNWTPTQKQALQLYMKARTHADGLRQQADVLQRSGQFVQASALRAQAEGIEQAALAATRRAFGS